jgi:flagellar motility protein MotE (MotC chaperone)
MTPVPAWVAPTIAISLVLIAASLVVLIAVAVGMALGMRRKSRAFAAQLSALSADAKAVSTRFRTELESYADLSSDARAKLRGAMDTVERRLQDLDALAEVLQAEVEETALSVGALLRTVRSSGKVLGAARRAIRRRRPAEHAG